MGQAWASPTLVSSIADIFLYIVPYILDAVIYCNSHGSHAGRAVRLSYNLISLPASLALGSWKTARKENRSLCTYCTRNGSCVGNNCKIGMGTWNVSITIQMLTVVYGQAEWEGGTDSALWLLPGDSHRLFLPDGSSKDYAWQASLCSDFAYVQT